MKKGFKQSVLRLRNVILILAVTWASLTQAQQFNNIEVFVCPTTSSTSITQDQPRAKKSDFVCSSGTRLYLEIESGASLVASFNVTRMDEPQDHAAKVDINWQEGTGTVVIHVKYKWMDHKVTTCKWREGYLYTYIFHREYVSPGGTITGTTENTVAGNQAASVFNLEYRPSPTLPANLVVKKIRYLNGVDPTMTEINVTKSMGTYTPTPIIFHTTGLGEFTLNVEAYTETDGGCGKWQPIAPKALSVHSSCYKDDFSGVAIIPTGPDVKPFSSGSPTAYGVKKNQVYSLSVSGITDFDGNYTFNFSDFGPNVTLNNGTFKVTKMGSYRITVTANVEGCPVPQAIPILVGGEDLTMIRNCGITLPDDVAQFYPELKPEDLLVKHFTAEVETQRFIVIKPGVTLEMGAELDLHLPPPQPDDGEDIKLNFVEQSSYDDYGRVVINSRSYFDKAGKPLQSQYRDISRNIILGNGTIYDALGRAAISTLPAPIRASQIVECEDDDKIPANVTFQYKPDFVTVNVSETKIVYNHNHFDGTNELTPMAVDGTDEGTLGWYYGAGNGTSTTSALHEPLVAKTGFPYSRTLFDSEGEATGATKPGDAFKAGSQYTAKTEKQPVEAGDSFFSATNAKSYLSIRKNELSLPVPASPVGEFFKTTATDEEGKKSVAYFDKSGNTIISVYYGLGSSPITTSYQFYNNAGSLVASISPEGLDHYNGSNFSTIDKTSYFYNSRGQLMAVEEKIAGQLASGISRTEYVYRKDGKIRFSQNEEQRKEPQRYSYTNYDEAGRPTESGEYQTASGSIAFNSVEMKAILESTEADGGLIQGTGTKKDRLYSFYDVARESLQADRVQHFITGAVSYTKKQDLITTSYSYDERGRVEWMIQDIKDLGVKTVDYSYGPTGQVQDVIYQKDVQTERFTHHYEYDADMRLKKVYTTPVLLTYDRLGKITNQGVTYTEKSGEIASPGPLELQAKYFYYLHGPLKRIELGNNIQGIDYVYTADGALKSINQANPEKDPGKDGITNDFQKDAFGMSLDYYGQDYVAANGTTDQATESDAVDQHSGLIKAMRWHSPVDRDEQVDRDKQVAYAYEYDSRNQLKKATFGTIVETVENGVASYAMISDPRQPYKEEISGYDLNGNINSLSRRSSVNLLESDNANISIADFSYHYKSGTNMLESITDDEEAFRSYSYDDLGRLKKETEGDNVKSRFMVYDVTGKIRGVYMDDQHSVPVTTFTYDDRGFRLSKTTHDEAGVLTFRTWYVRDAAGNVMGTYQQDLREEEETGEPVDHSPKLAEVPVYASGRIGIYDPANGHTAHEITDHLGNVRAVIGEEFQMSFRATMESGDRHLQEIDDGFQNLDGEATATYINHTPSDFEVDGHPVHIDGPIKVDRLNNSPNGQYQPDPIGTGIMLWVHPGDIIQAEVFAKYTNFDSQNKNFIAAMAGFLTSSFMNVPVIDGNSIFNVVNTPDFKGLPAFGKLNQNQPRAFLNYLLFDNNNKLVDYDFRQVNGDAEISTSDPFNQPHQRLSFDELIIEKEGYIYIYVSNESTQNMEVYFDDLTVTQKYSNIVAGGDYYPFGLPIKDRQIDRQEYRFGYQGQFSEQDDETGWNHFELREYDPVIGRWTATDPAGQYWSPYIGMGNNPISGVDPDGAFKTEFGARWYAFWHGGGDIEMSMAGANKGEWYVGNQVVLNEEGVGVAYQQTFDWGIDAEFNFNISSTFGAQLGAHVTGITGVDASLASITLAELDLNFGYSSKIGFWASDRDILPSHLLDPKMVQFFTADFPGIGGSINRNQMVKDRGRNTDTFFNVHSGRGVVLNGEHHIESGQTGFPNLTISGGARAGLGVDFSLGLKLK